jgi:hypothetical protein
MSADLYRGWRLNEVCARPFAARGEGDALEIVSLTNAEAIRAGGSRSALAAVKAKIDAMTPADLRAVPLAFGGLALVPVSDAGRDWLDQSASDWEGDGNILYDGRHPCMTGLPTDAIGFEPQDWPNIVAAAREAGLTVVMTGDSE